MLICMNGPGPELERCGDLPASSCICELERPEFQIINDITAMPWDQPHHAAKLIDPDRDVSGANHGKFDAQTVVGPCGNRGHAARATVKNVTMYAVT